MAVEAGQQGVWYAQLRLMFEYGNEQYALVRCVRHVAVWVRTRGQPAQSAEQSPFLLAAASAEHMCIPSNSLPCSALLLPSWYEVRARHTDALTKAGCIPLRWATKAVPGRKQGAEAGRPHYAVSAWLAVPCARACKCACKRACMDCECMQALLVWRAGALVCALHTHSMLALLCLRRR